MSIFIESLGLNIFTSPKVMSTSLKHLAYFLDSGHEFTPVRVNGREQYVHKFYPLHEFSPSLILGAALNIAVIRSPLSRFQSLYQDRLFESREHLRDQYRNLSRFGLERYPTIEAFAEKLSDYCDCVRDLAHHSKPQTHYLGINPEVFDVVFDMDDLDSLESYISEVARTRISIPRRHVSTQRAGQEVTHEVQRHIERLYATDFDFIRRAGLG